MKRQVKRRLKRVAAESDEENENDFTAKDSAGANGVSSAGDVIQSAEPADDNTSFAQELMAAANDDDKAEEENEGRARRLLKRRKAKQPTYSFAQ